MPAPTFNKLTLFERLLTLFTAVRPGEGRSVFLMLLQIFLLLQSYYVIRVVRETLILVEGTPVIRAYATGAIAITLIFVIPLYKLLFDYLKDGGNKSVVLRWVGWFFITNIIVFALLIWLGIPIAVPFYIWVGVYNVMVIAQFWAFAADLFNIRTGQRLFAVIMMGAAFGAMLGSQIAGQLYAVIGAANLLLLSAALLGCVLYLSRVAERTVPEGSRGAATARAPEPERTIIGRVMGGFSLVAKSGYLFRIALFIVVLNLVNTNGGYILTTFMTEHARAVVAAAAGAISTGDVYSRAWGNYLAGITGLQIVLQLFLVSRIFRWFGVKGAILVLPLVMITSYGLILLFPVFALVRLMMILENATNYSVQNTTNHTLYLPVPRQEKYVGKTTIDTFVNRFGDLLSTGLIALMAQLLGLEIGWIVAVNLLLAGILFGIGTAIGRYHHGEIRHQLENLPPEIRAPLPDVYVPAGQVLVFSVPEKSFMDPDPGDTLSYAASRASGEPLPSWVHFDRFNQTFTVRPPHGSEGSESVILTATDFEGLSVKGGFRIDYGADPVPRFSAAPAAAQPAPPAPRADAGGDIVPAAPRSRE